MSNTRHPANVQAAAGRNGEELSNTTRTFRCHYRDIRNRNKPTVLLIQAESIYSAVERFITERRYEGWRTVEIFEDALLRVVDETLQIQYTLNKFGEPEFDREVNSE